MTNLYDSKITVDGAKGAPSHVLWGINVRFADGFTRPETGPEFTSIEDAATAVEYVIENAECFGEHPVAVSFVGYRLANDGRVRY